MSFFFLAITVFTMFLQPVAIFPWLEPFSPLRNFTVIAFICYLLTSQVEKGVFFDTKINKFFLLFVLVQLIGPMLIWPGSIINNFVTWLLYVLIYYLLIVQCVTIQKIRKVFLLIVIAISFLCIYSIETFVLNHEPGLRASGYGWYENSNDLSFILACTIPLIMYIADTQKNLCLKLLYLMLAALFVLNILFTGSRTGLLAVAFVAGACLYFSVSFSKSIKVIISIILLFSIFGTGLNVVMSRGDLKGIYGDDSSENRITQWEAGLNMVISHPFVGVGPDQFGDRAEEFGGIKGLAPHNTLVQVFAESGVPGGYFFIMFSFFPVVLGWGEIKGGKLKPFVESVLAYKYLFVSLCGYWICAFFSNRYKSYILFVLIALFVAVNNIIKGNRSNKRMNQDDKINCGS